MVWGVATTEAVDSQGDIVDYEASKAAFPEWLGNIREMHGAVAIGKAIDMQFDDDTKQVMIGAKISESTDGENAWIKVKEGILQGFSIGGNINKVKKETAKVNGNDVTVTRIVDYDLSEVSLVDNPANPEAMLLMVKSQQGGLQRVEENLEGAEIQKQFHVPFWHAQFMLPMEKGQALYDKSMKAGKLEKAGVNVVDGDPRNAAAATVSEVTTSSPKKGGTVVPKKVYASDGKTTTNKAEGATMKKGMWDASFLLDLAIELNYYIQNEQYEGEDVADLESALATIKQAVVKELTEPTAELTVAVELATKVSDLAKASKGKVEKSTSVAGGEERNADAEVVTTAEENGRPLNDTEERAADAGVAVAGAEVTDKDGEVVLDDEGKPVVQEAVHAEAPADADEEKKDDGAKSDKASDAKADDKGKATPAKKDDKSTDEEAEKAVTTGTLKKFTNELMTKLEDGNKAQFTKMLGELTDKVEGEIAKAVAPLADRLKTLEDQPAAAKVSASFSTIEKGKENDSSDDGAVDVQALLKRQEVLMLNPNEGTPAERIELAAQLRKAQSAGADLTIQK